MNHYEQNELAEDMAFFPDMKTRMTYEDMKCEMTMSMKEENGTIVMDMDFEGDCGEDFFQKAMEGMNDY